MRAGKDVLGGNEDPRTMHPALAIADAHTPRFACGRRHSPRITGESGTFHRSGILAPPAHQENWRLRESEPTEQRLLMCRASNTRHVRLVSRTRPSIAR